MILAPCLRVTVVLATPRMPPIATIIAVLLHGVALVACLASMS